MEEVYRGDGLWVLNKPARLLSHPNPPAREAHNAILLVPYDARREVYRARSEDGRDREVELLHRLDQDTSGLIVLASDLELAARLKELFFHHEIQKEYHALVKGVPASREGIWADRLVRKKQGQQVRVTTERGGRPNAETRYRVLRVFRGGQLSLLGLSPISGKTHQLRVQTAVRGHPIAGDERYGDFPWNRELRAEIELKRMALHAFRMRFRHPTTGRNLRFEADPGKSIHVPLENLEGRPRGK